jgi:hypothetical protein
MEAPFHPPALMERNKLIKSLIEGLGVCVTMETDISPRFQALTVAANLSAAGPAEGLQVGLPSPIQREIWTHGQWPTLEWNSPLRENLGQNLVFCRTLWEVHKSHNIPRREFIHQGIEYGRENLQLTMAADDEIAIV